MPSQNSIQICSFTWGDWHALWRVRLAQLAEHGALLDVAAIPPQPEMVATDDPEWDFHDIATVYLRSPGSLWLAWDGAQPISSMHHECGVACAEAQEL